MTSHWYSAGQHCRYQGRECVIARATDRGICRLGYQELALIELGSGKRHERVFGEDVNPMLHVIPGGKFPRLVWSDGETITP